jgi:hypothetical protein
MQGYNVGLGKILERISESQLKRAKVTANANSINHGLMKNVKNVWMKGGRLNCSAFITQAEFIADILNNSSHETNKHFSNKDRLFEK